MSFFRDFLDAFWSMATQMVDVLRVLIILFAGFSLWVFTLWGLYSIEGVAGRFAPPIYILLTILFLFILPHLTEEDENDDE